MEIKADEPIRCVLDTRAKRAASLHLLTAEAGTSDDRGEADLMQAH
jgi:hypothetical protein